MPTRKELLAGLLHEAEELGEALDSSAEASEELRAGLDCLRDDIAAASTRFESTADGAIEDLSRRLTLFREELAETFDEGATALRKGLFEGHLIGGLVSGLAGGILQNAIRSRETDPRWIIARRTYQALHVIADAYSAGGRHGYKSTLRLLRIHEFKAEQARHILDLLLKTGAVKEYEEGGVSFIMIDPDSEAFRKVAEGIENNTLTYLTVRDPDSESEG